MNSHSKSSINFRKKAEFDTTLSAKMQGKSTNFQQPKVSPFKLEYSNDISLQASHCKQLSAIKNINFQYVTLYNNLFKQNKQLLHLFQQDIVNTSSQNLTRQRKYQLQCLKLLTQTSQNIQRMKQMRQVRQEWRQLTNYIQQKYKTKSNNYQLQLCQNGKLFQKYRENAEKIKQLQDQYKNLSQTNIQSKDQRNLSNIQKQFKKTQKKLNKVLAQQLYYSKKCTQQQDKLEEAVDRIQRLEQGKLNLEMKIICEQGRMDKMIRKSKRLKQKLIADAYHKQAQSHNKRFKSLVKNIASQNYY